MRLSPIAPAARSRQPAARSLCGIREETEGSLEPGKVAGLIIVSQDLFQVAPASLGKTTAILTMVGGKVVYESPASKNQ